jgi:hypothetical protein
MAKIKKILIACIVVSLAILAIAIPAQANDKFRETVVVDELMQVDWLCDFVFTVHQYGKINLTYSINNDGFLGYREAGGDFKVEMYVTPDKKLNAHFQGPYQWQDLNAEGTDWIEKATGPNQFIVIPGYGPVYGRTGNTTVRVTILEDNDVKVELLKFSGLSFNEQEGIDAICSYLQP